MFLVTLQLFSVCFSVSRHVVRLVATQSEHVVPLLISAVTRIKCHLPAAPHYSQLCTVKELCPNSPWHRHLKPQHNVTLSWVPVLCSCMRKVVFVFLGFFFLINCSGSIKKLFAEGSCHQSLAWWYSDSLVGFERKIIWDWKLALQLNIFGIKLGFHSNNISCLCFLFNSRELLGKNTLLLSLLHHIKDNNNFLKLSRKNGSPSAPIKVQFFSLGYNM